MASASQQLLKRRGGCPFALDKKRKHICNEECQLLFGVKQKDRGNKHQVLGAGAFGTVHREDLTMCCGRVALCAAKVLRMSIFEGGKKELALDEMRGMEQLCHKNIVWFVDSQKDKKFLSISSDLIIFMELCDYSLSKIIERHKKALNPPSPSSSSPARSSPSTPRSASASSPSTPRSSPSTPSRSPSSPSPGSPSTPRSSPSSPSSSRNSSSTPSLWIPTLHYMLDILTGIKYLHENNLIHRDLKPANVLVRVFRDQVCPLGHPLSELIIEENEAPTPPSSSSFPPPSFPSIPPSSPSHLHPPPSSPTPSPSSPLSSSHSPPPPSSTPPIFPPPSPSSSSSSSPPPFRQTWGIAPSPSHEPSSSSPDSPASSRSRSPPRSPPRSSSPSPSSSSSSSSLSSSSSDPMAILLRRCGMCLKGIWEKDVEQEGVEPPTRKELQQLTSGWVGCSSCWFDLCPSCGAQLKQQKEEEQKQFKEVIRLADLGLLTTIVQHHQTSPSSEYSFDSPSTTPSQASLLTSPRLPPSLLSPAVRANESVLTRTLCGTPAYLAPEVWKGAKYGKKVDIWSAGCIFFELLSGKGFFMTLKEMGLNVETREDVKGVIEGSKEVPKLMKPLLLGMLEVDPRKRMKAEEAMGGVQFLLKPENKMELEKEEEERKKAREKERVANTRAWKKVIRKW